MAEQHVEIEQLKLRILKTISEGGFGIVYLVENENRQGPKMALKKIITQDAERYRIAAKELSFLKSYCAKPTNVFINYLASKVVEEQPQKFAFYILIEFCANGTLFDLMAVYMQRGQRFSEEEILVLLRAINSCLIALHSIGIIHCDFKIENLLFFNWESVKLCDFGSVNNFNLDFSQIPKQQFYSYEVLFEKQTTLMYRPPEMCDLYLGYKVNNKVDMWMLGCVLFTLMFFKHPFHESSKLSIVSASYYWPEGSSYSEKLENLTRNLLTPNPDFRPNANDVKDLLDNWESIEVVELNKMAHSIKRESTSMRRNLNTNLNSRNPSSQNVNEWISDRPQKQQKNNDFDFSGLDRLSKKNPPPSDIKAKKQDQNNNFSSFNFMNLDFGSCSNQELQQPTSNAPENRHSLETIKRNSTSFDIFDLDNDGRAQQQPVKQVSNNFDPFDIDFTQ
jgi:AP2-associated kinase